MPSSRPNVIPTIIHLVRQLKPRSILDVGIGFGKWGHLFREYTDILEAEHDPKRYQRANWKVRIDGIEGHAPYITEMHRFLYNQIYVGEACSILPTLSAYDLIFAGDMIEHLDKETGLRFLSQAMERSHKAVIVTTPKHETEQEDLCGNPLERHRSLWSARDFRRFDGAIVKTIDRSILLALFPRPGIGPLRLGLSTQANPSDARRTLNARKQLIKLIPLDAPFVIVDEEQIRHQLPHRAAMPFLERAGQYWGPPADDQTAIRELRTMARRGVRYVAFFWGAFWWLDYYRGFKAFLQASGRRIHATESVVIYRLRKP